MDFMQDRYDVAGHAEAGAKLHLLDPNTSEQIYDDGKPVTITVRGIEGDSAKAVGKKHNRLKAKGVIVPDDVAGMDVFKASITAWEGIGFNGEDMDCTPENIEILLTARDWIAQQVLAFMLDRNNFFTG